jgi:hypothetical protein
MTHYYVDTLGGVLIAKHAVGPERAEDGTEYQPVVPDGWIEVQLDVYLAIPIGAQVEITPGPPLGIREKARPPIPPPPAQPPRTERLDERLARIEGRLTLLETPGVDPRRAPRDVSGPVPTDGIDWS